MPNPFTRRMIAPLLFGLGGAGILIGLGLWQLQRLDWKTAKLAEIAARITAAPVALPTLPDPVAALYLPVTLSGSLTGRELDVLTSIKDAGPGYRVIAGFLTADGRQVMVDLGFLPEAARNAPRPTGMFRVTGNLVWPNETDSFTPVPDRNANIWFARDVALMSQALQTEPLLVAARTVDPAIAEITPLPVDTAGIANDHFQYAMTWFSLTVGWLGMTGLLLWRIRQRSV